MQITPSTGANAAAGYEKNHDTVNKPSIRAYREKYAVLLGTNIALENPALYPFMDEWLGAPYRYGGNSGAGVDCSRLSILLMQEVFGKKISGSSAAICNQTKPVAEKNLQEGDLVFFKINSSSINHMGVYLTNYKFIHATVQAGVTVSDLREKYYQSSLAQCGRLP